jgi:hypothetical protein
MVPTGGNSWGGPGAVLARLKDHLDPRSVCIDIPKDFPMLYVDGVLRRPGGFERIGKVDIREIPSHSCG